MSVVDNKNLVRRFYDEAVGARDLDAVDRLLAPDFRHDGEERGHAGQRDAVAAFLGGFSDLRHEVVLCLGEDDLVAATQRWRGTHDGEFLEVPATGREVGFTSTTVLRVVDGLITEAWGQVDVAGLLAQITDERAGGRDEQQAP